MLQVFMAFAVNDMRSVRRDSLLSGIIATPWFLGLFLRLAVPGLGHWTQTKFGIALHVYYPLILGIFVLLNVPLLIGVMSGFLLLEERDTDTLTAIRVTPSSVDGLIVYRMLTGWIISTLYILLCVWLSGLTPPSIVIDTLSAALLASCFAPVATLAIAAFAKNKLEGLAMIKGVGIIVVGTSATFFVAARWQMAFGVLPTFWSVKSFWLAMDHQPYSRYLIIGVLYHFVLILVLMRRFRKEILRT